MCKQFDTFVEYGPRGFSVAKNLNANCIRIDAISHTFTSIQFDIF